MTDYNCNIWITECTHERKDFAEFPEQEEEFKHGSFLCSSDMLIAISFVILEMSSLEW